MPTFLIAAVSGTAAGVSIALLFIYLGKCFIKSKLIDALYEHLLLVCPRLRLSSKNSKDFEGQSAKSDSSCAESEEEEKSPKRVGHELVPLCQSCRKVSTQANPCPCDAPSTGQNPCRLQLSLLYNFHDSHLFIQIICALNVPVRWHGRYPSTQVRFQILPDVWNFYQTEVQHNKSQPIYNETFEFIGYSHTDLMDLTLRLGLFAFDKFSQGHMIGYITLPLSEVEWNPNQPTILWREFQPKSQTSRERSLSFSRGELHVSLRYEGQASRISAIVLKATNLPRTSLVWSTVPYVTVTLLLGGKTIETKETKKKRNQSPVWNQGFLFDVDASLIDQYSLVFRVMDYDLLLSDQLLGEVKIGANEPENTTGRKHWDEMMRKAKEHKKRETAMYHTL